MMVLAGSFFSTDNLVPHGYSYAWRTDLVVTEFVGDALIGLSLWVVAYLFWYTLYKRPDSDNPLLVFLFGLFIFACGATHILTIIAIWVPNYPTNALVKLVAGLVSIVTAVMTIPAIRQGLTMPTPLQLHHANQELSTFNRELEERVQQRTAELDRSNKELERFAYVASHDLKEPLNTTRSFLELLRLRTEGKLDPANQHLVNRSLASTQRLQGLIEALLEYSRAGRRTREFSDVNMPDMVERIRNALASDLDAGQYVIRYEGESSVFTDAELLDSMLQNLVTNAIKYRSARPLEVAISTRKTDTAWLISVKDNGIGIAAEHHELIFEMFQRLHAASDIPGSGMGLAICKRIATHLGGKIGVESELGLGSTFTIELPIYAGRQGASQAKGSA